EPGTYAVNEDSAAIATAHGHTLLAVADGLGGYADGELASRTAVGAVVERFRAKPSLTEAGLRDLVLDAHRALIAAGASRERGPRTTLTLLVSDGVAARWAHVGDSRLYFFHGGRITSRTRDHSVPELLARANEIEDSDIRHHPDRNRLLQALGQDSPP